MKLNLNPDNAIRYGVVAAILLAIFILNVLINNLPNFLDMIVLSIAVGVTWQVARKSVSWYSDAV